MNTIKAIETRQSVREFKNKKPDWRDIIEAINSARYAPMAGNFFSLKFIIIDKEEIIKEIAEYSEQDFIENAKYCVIFISEPEVTKTPYKEKGETYMRQQAGAAIQNFMLHLTNAELSTCWIGHFNENKIKKLINIPESKIIEAIFPVGHSKEKLKTKSPKGDIDKILFFNEWGNKRMKEIKKIEARGPGYY